MKSVAIVLFLTFLGCCAALPVELEDHVGPIIGIPVLIRPAKLENEKSDTGRLTYALLLGKLEDAKEEFDGKVIEKRNVEEKEQEDLDTAAGTYALRPLFVYRQQLAYRQRTRNAYRQRNRF